MHNLLLTDEQCQRILHSGRLSGIVSDRMMGRSVATLSAAEVASVAAAVFADASIVKVRFPETGESVDTEIVVAEAEGIIAVWSDSTDWVGPFESLEEAVGFVERNLLDSRDRS
jgi:hypothetical protein